MKLSCLCRHLINAPFIVVLRVYQYCVSPLLGPRCRFDPSCSHYAVSAFQQYALPKALLLTVKRVAKCHPWHEGGYDPLPKNKYKH